MVSDRIKNLTPSATVELTSKVADMRAAGIDVIAYNVGEPDFNTPDNIIKACEKAMEEGKTKYTPASGIIPLRKAICKKLEKDNNVHYEMNQICVSTGAKQALNNAVLAICNPGDEIIVPTPCWVSYVEIIKLAEGKPVLVPTSEQEGFQLNVDAIAKAITPKTRAILINTPNNPTGALYTEESLRALGKLAVEHDLYIISDEVYEKLIYGDRKHICPASLGEDVKEHTIVVNGFSKAYSMTGWRVGHTAAPADIAKGISSLQGHTTSNATSFVQWACLEALEERTDPAVETMRQEFNRRRDYLIQRLRAIPDVFCADADGAFYLMPNVSKYYGRKEEDGRVINNSSDFCNYILDEAKVAIVPGSAFEAPDNVRISYSNSMENIQKGIDRIEAAMAKLK